MIKSDIQRHLEARHSGLLRFWTDGRDMPDASIEAHCDMVYTLAMLGELGGVPQTAVDAFLQFLRTKNLPGWSPEGDQPVILVHNGAYAFGALNLLAKDPAALYDQVLSGRKADLGSIVDPQTHRPLFPKRWAHHSWRVSHWIGGIPSIILSLSRSGSKYAGPYRDLIDRVMDALSIYIDPRSGLLKAYRSEAAQLAFRRFYALRHDPVLGDLGGVAHVLWIDHALGRRYVASQDLLELSRRRFYEAKPFCESVPYCLDFDVVQIVRTAAEQCAESTAEDAAHATAMMRSIEEFFGQSVPDTYTLHKVPGALATYHECAIMAGQDTRSELSIDSLDIIRRANWL